MLTCRSLDPECTPLKHRYDSCFNTWFEGYLQPALDSRSTEILSSRQQPSASTSSSSTTSPAQSTTSEIATQEVQSEIPLRKPLVTSWANAFRTRPRPVIDEAPLEDISDSYISHDVPEMQRSSYKIDTRGKTRAQIKAEEYEKACGEPWRLYQSCLKVCPALSVQLMAESGCPERQSNNVAGTGEGRASVGESGGASWNSVGSGAAGETIATHIEAAGV